MSREAREVGHLADSQPGDTVARRIGASLRRVLLLAATLTGSLLVVGAGTSPAGAQTLPAAAGGSVGHVTDAASPRVDALVDHAAASARTATGRASSTVGSVTETATSVPSPIMAPGQELAGAAAATSPKISAGVKKKIAGTRVNARLEVDAERDAVEVTTTTAILRARARLDANALSMTASLDVGGIHAGLALPPPPPSETRTLSVVTGDLAFGRPAAGAPTEGMLPSPWGPGSESLVHARGLSDASPESDPGIGTGDGSRAPPGSPLRTTAGFGSGLRLHDLSEQAVAVGVLALLVLTLTGRLSPSRSTPRSGLPQPVVVPG